MSESRCPLCDTALQVRDVAPCFDCGHDPAELVELAAGEHTYDEVTLLGSRAVLCDFCQLDFPSYDPTFFGRPRGARLGGDIQVVRRIAEPAVTRDEYCPCCDHRLAFLRFVKEARSAPQLET